MTPQNRHFPLLFEWRGRLLLPFSDHVIIALFLSVTEEEKVVETESNDCASPFEEVTLQKKTPRPKERPKQHTRRRRRTTGSSKRYGKSSPFFFFWHTQWASLVDDDSLGFFFLLLQWKDQEGSLLNCSRVLASEIGRSRKIIRSVTFTFMDSCLFFSRREKQCMPVWY